MSFAEFEIRRGTALDEKGILAVMKEAEKEAGKKGWFVADDEAFIKEHIKESGFVMVAEPVKEPGKTVAFFIVHIPGKGKENLGWDIGLSEEELFMAAHMESAAVLSGYRGFGLQGRLLEAAEKQLADTKYRFYLATVHPDNIASLHTMEKHGYRIQLTKEKYGHLRRHILMKEAEK